MGLDETRVLFVLLEIHAVVRWLRRYCAIMEGKFEVQSAGVFAYPGSDASVHAKEALAEKELQSIMLRSR